MGSSRCAWDQLEKSQLQMEALFLAVVQIVKCAENDLQIARELLLR